MAQLDPVAQLVGQAVAASPSAAPRGGAKAPRRPGRRTARRVAGRRRRGDRSAAWGPDVPVGAGDVPWDSMGTWHRLTYQKFGMFFGVHNAEV